jgi:UDP-N-acetylmuramyl tripeptide synthase
MWQLLIIIISKTVMRISRLLGKNGTALPGLLVERLAPATLERLLAQIKGGVIIITGTNGKTTTAKILRHMLESKGLRVLANRSGSNYTRGIYASVVEHTDHIGKLPFDIAVIEVDEAYTPHIARIAKPTIMLVLNIVRDQLDRYGEIDNTARIISRAVEYCGGIVLNTNDTPVAKLSDYCEKDQVSYFGASKELLKFLPSDKELHGIAKEAKLTTKPSKITTLASVKKLNGKSQVVIQSDKQRIDIKTAMEGVHNALNITAALAAYKHCFGTIENGVITKLEDVKPAFGRGERLVVDGVTVHLALVKNPAGFNQNLRALINDQVGHVLVVINDRYADGRDVSWLWDVDMTTMTGGNKNFTVSTSGVRAYDMALRFNYEDIKVANIDTSISRGLTRALSTVSDGKDLLILPTYTAMLEIRKMLSKRTLTEEIWH